MDSLVDLSSLGAAICPYDLTLLMDLRGVVEFPLLRMVTSKLPTGWTGNREWVLRGWGALFHQYF